MLLRNTLISEFKYTLITIWQWSDCSIPRQQFAKITACNVVAIDYLEA